jgi:hypothetical protein
VLVVAVLLGLAWIAAGAHCGRATPRGFAAASLTARGRQKRRAGDDVANAGEQGAFD